VRSAFLLFGPLLMLGSCMATALADVPMDAGAPGAGSVDHLLALGPYGALVWGAYLLGRGVKVTVQVELSERDRELIGRLDMRGAHSQ
jgi:hypothetical protein